MEEIVEGTVGALHILARESNNRALIRAQHVIRLAVSDSSSKLLINLQKDLQFAAYIADEHTRSPARNAGYSLLPHEV